VGHGTHRQPQRGHTHDRIARAEDELLEALAASTADPRPTTEKTPTAGQDTGGSR
jgi:hypothetical protein